MWVLDTFQGRKVWYSEEEVSKYENALKEIKRLATKYSEKQVRYEMIRIINEVLECTKQV